MIPEKPQVCPTNAHPMNAISTNGETFAPPVLVTVAEACRMLSLGKTKIFSLAASGELERVRIGGGTRITVRSIMRIAGV